MPYLLTILIVKFEIVHSTLDVSVILLFVCCMPNTADPDQTPSNVASDLGLHSLQRSICP